MFLGDFVWWRYVKIHSPVFIRYFLEQTADKSRRLCFRSMLHSCFCCFVACFGGKGYINLLRDSSFEKGEILCLKGKKSTAVKHSFVLVNINFYIAICAVQMLTDWDVLFFRLYRDQNYKNYRVISWKKNTEHEAAVQRDTVTAS